MVKCQTLPKGAWPLRKSLPNISSTYCFSWLEHVVLDDVVNLDVVGHLLCVRGLDGLHVEHALVVGDVRHGGALVETLSPLAARAVSLTLLSFTVETTKTALSAQKYTQQINTSHIYKYI